MEATIDKCLAFCQALVSSNQKFTFTLSIGKETSKFDNKELVASSRGKSLKRKSPSQIRREDRRREARKSKITEEVVKDPAVTAPQTPKAAEKTAVLSFKCEQCEYTSTSEKGLKQHVRMKHKTLQPKESLRHSGEGSASLSASLTLDTTREEKEPSFSSTPRKEKEVPATSPQPLPPPTRPTAPRGGVTAAQMQESLALYDALYPRRTHTKPVATK